jgi:oligoribonuclease
MNYLSATEILKAERILWADFEATGLDFETHTVPLELAAIVTDGLLNEVATFGSYAVATNRGQLSHMNEYVTNMHTKTGLVNRVLSDEAITVEALDERFAEFVSTHFPAKGKFIPAGSVLTTGRLVTADEKFAGPIIGGSSVKYDWSMIRQHLPETFELMDYRVIDSSSFREVIRRFLPAVYDQMPKVEAPHEAMTDIRMSIEELRWLTGHGLTADVAQAEFAGASSR